MITEPLERWRETGALQHYVTSVGSSGALAMRVDDDAADRARVRPGAGRCSARRWTARVSQAEVISYLRENIKPLPGMKFSVEEVEDGPPGGAEVGSG